MLKGLSVMLLALSLVACDSEGNKSNDVDYDTPLRATIAGLGLTGDPTTERSITDINDPEAQLGMKLFYSKALGGSKDSACVTCHHPMLGGGDGLSLSIGANALDPDLLGPGRQHSPAAPDYWLGSPTGPRNAPTTFNVALYTRGMFWDAKVEATAKGIITPDSRNTGGFSSNIDSRAVDIVSAQARFPVTSKVEMKGHVFEEFSDRDTVRAHLAARIGDYGIGLGELVNNQWRVEFESVYGNTLPVAQLISFERIVQAIGAYERSQVFVENPWKAYVEGNDSALSSAAKRGALLFLRTREEGGANCLACHSGDFFTDEQFHVIATPQVGRGRGDGPRLNDDYGRYKVTRREEDRYAFRTPSLLNVAVTGPWGHAGSYTSLEAVVRHYIDPELALQQYDYGQLDPLIPVADTVANTRDALEVLKRNREQGILTVENVPFNDREVQDLVAFLHALTDPCVTQRECLAPWITDTDSDGPDGLQLNAHDRYGNKL